MQSLFNVYKSWTIYKIIENQVKVHNIIQVKLLLFSLQTTQFNIYGGAFFAKEVNSSLTFMVGLFLQKKLTAESC